MLKLLEVEWIKLKYYRSFWVILSFFVLAVFVFNYFAYMLTGRHISGVNKAFTFPDVWNTVTYISGFLFFIPAMLFITLITNEINFRTNRQNIVNGVSRTQYVQIKFIFIILLSITFTISVYLCAITFGLFCKAAFSFNHTSYICFFFLQCLSYSSLSLVFAMFIKKAGLAIASFILYAWIFEKSLSGIFNAAFKYNVGNYLPLSASDKLIPIPMGRDLSGQLLGTGSVPIQLIMTVIYLIIFYQVAMFKAKHEDI